MFENNKQKTAIIIGAGPAGLTAALELLDKTDIKPVIFEMSSDIGGLSKTVKYKGNRIDIGGHRFFSKSDFVMKWWEEMMPVQGAPSSDDLKLKREIPLSKKAGAPDPEIEDKVLLIRQRLSRIFFLRKFFEYPVKLSYNTLSNLGIVRVVKIITSYIKARLFPEKDEKTLEGFFINRFGKELYEIFFKYYTEKLWGKKCTEISSDWGAQRVKGVSISKAVRHAVKSIFVKDNSLTQKNTETSLIGQFLYPKYGPGQMWEEAARKVIEKGGKIILDSRAIGFTYDGNKFIEGEFQNTVSGEIKTLTADYFFSTMPVKDLINGLGNNVPIGVKEIAEGLEYRDFITVGLLLNKLKIMNESKIPSVNGIIPDNWVYVQDRDVKMLRVQIFNNWSPYLLNDSDKVWVGIEYTCNEGDELWNKSDKEMSDFAVKEMENTGMAGKEDVLDSVVIRMQKAYPVYLGAYYEFHKIREFVDRFENLFLIGRNGMHRYNNMDHSMLSAMKAVENITKGDSSKDAIWEVNAEKEYHEEKAA
jgi:protoporphyrinogen oxidase